jgi:hypothetical protein
VLEVGARSVILPGQRGKHGHAEAIQMAERRCTSHSISSLAVADMKSWTWPGNP